MPETIIPDQSTFEGPQLWIYHDANHRQARPYRHQVFSHIQRNYRPWRRSQPAKSLRYPTIIHEDTDEDEFKSPKTILAKGNSDPFGVYPVRIGPEENELVAFYRDVFLPAQYGEVGPNSQMSGPRAIDWEKCIGGFTDEGVASALLARWGQIAGRCTPFVRKAALTHQYRGTHLLRTKILQGKDLQDENDCMHISHLFSAETAGRNASGALAHATMLRTMLQQAWDQGTLNHRFLTWQVHQDMQRAVIFLSPPVFDVDEWLPMVYAPLENSIIVEIPPVDSGTTSKLDRSIEDPTLVDLFQQARAYWQFRRIRNENPYRYSPPESLAWHAVQEFLLLGRLVNYYVNIKNRLERDYITKKLKRQLLIQQYLSLAAIYLLKSFNLNPVVFGVPIFDAAPVVLPALRQCLEDSNEMSNLARSKNYKNARLWALYVGAWAEQEFPKTDSASDPCREWFNTQLARHALAMGLDGWAEVKPILMRFLYAHRAGPSDGAIWFERTLYGCQGNGSP